MERRAGLSPTTQGDYLAALCDMLQLGFLKGCLEKNFAEGIQPLKRDTVADRDKRKRFSEKQVKDFFASDFYQSCAPDAAKPDRKNDRDWRKWMPLIMAFSGAHPNEIAQLRVRDFQKTDGGTAYVDLSGLEVKTESSKRKTPIRPNRRQCLTTRPYIAWCYLPASDPDKTVAGDIRGRASSFTRPSVTGRNSEANTIARSFSSATCCSVKAR